nr:uncharacterized protein C16orf92 homolog isoform X2 [Microcebus murinus]
MVLGCDIIEPPPHNWSGGAMRLCQWVLAWVWLAGLGAIETDSDQAKVLAVARFIGERPVVFTRSGSNSELFQHILVGALVLAFFFLLFQFCTHVAVMRRWSCPLLRMSLFPLPVPPPPPFQAPKNWVKRALVAFTQIVFISGL